MGKSPCLHGDLSFDDVGLANILLDLARGVYS